jgi:transcriptional regulator of acetoin/glycerol metabolism
VREGVLSELRESRERHDAELRKLIARAVHAGARSQDIADALGISRATLWRRYRDALRHSKGTNSAPSG